MSREQQEATIVARPVDSGSGPVATVGPVIGDGVRARRTITLEFESGNAIENIAATNSGGVSFDICGTWELRDVGVVLAMIAGLLVVQ